MDRWTLSRVPPEKSSNRIINSLISPSSTDSPRTWAVRLVPLIDLSEHQGNEASSNSMQPRDDEEGEDESKSALNQTRASGQSSYDIFSWLYELDSRSHVQPNEDFESEEADHPLLTEESPGTTSQP
jgi:hypothetical protein